MSLECRILSDNAQERQAWDGFVRSSPDGTIFHLLAWRRVVEEVFRHAPHYLFATRNGEIRAVLPLFEIWGLLAGHVLISVPYSVYGGLCGSDPDARMALLDKAKELAEQLKVRYVELRHLHAPAPHLPTTSFFDTFVILITDSPDANMANIPRKRRAMIREGIRRGLEARRGWEPLSEFYEIYARNRQRLGAPPFSLRLFEAVRDHLGLEAQLLTVWREGRMAAGVISFLYHDRVMPYYGAALPEAFPLAVNDFMYWELMRESCLLGFRIFDFGQSHSGSGTYEYKRHWGAMPEPLAYQYLLNSDTTFPQSSPSSPRRRPLIAAWKCLPLPLTKWIGPVLIRRLPLH
jgi:FemAB-related protein (PEP-CTERM system-associated)